MRKALLHKQPIIPSMVGLIVILVWGLNIRSASAQILIPSSRNQDPDLSNAIIRLEDLPAAFQVLTVDELAQLESALEIWESSLEDQTEAKLVNTTGFRTVDLQNLQFVVTGLISPLSSAEEAEIDLAFTQPDMLIDRLGGEDTYELPMLGSIGISRIGFSTVVMGMRLDYVVARRGPVLVEVAVIYSQEGKPLISAIDIAGILDERVAAEVGSGEISFRTSGQYVPEITTYIPTPLDVSTKPSVIGTNLLLAALLMLPFAVAAELFTRILGEHEVDLRKKFRPVEWISRLQKQLENMTGTRFGRRPALQDTLKLIGVIVFYGLVFSLLDRTWKPFSLQGLILFLSMAIAYGVVGIADDIIQWRTIRKWGLSANLTLRPTNFLLAMASTTTSRLLSMVPGLMFGTPEALQTEEEQFDEQKRNSLLRISTLTFVLIGLGVWLPTIATAALQKLSLPENTLNLIGGLEGFLLVIFAVALENLFVQMLGFPGGFGQALKRRNKWLWLAVLTAVTFLFYHTLINPRGELAEALETGNVRLFLSMAATFVVVAFGLWMYFKWQEQRSAGPVKVTPAPVATATRPEILPPALLRTGPVASSTPTPSPIPPVIAPVFLQPIVMVPVVLPADVQTQATIVSINETKQCPVCCNLIKAEARVCRFCKATFSVKIRGYCLTDHEVMETTAEGKCLRCNNELMDLHVESRLLNAPAVLPVQATQAAVAPMKAQTSMDTKGATRPCPACGKTIKAEARICRFCRTRLDTDLSPADLPPIRESLTHSSAIASETAPTQIQKPTSVMENLGPQHCPKCKCSLDERKGSPISPYINSYSCSNCGWIGFKCGKAGCDGYLKPEEVGYPNSVRYNCIKCGWTGMGPRVGF